MAYPMNDKTMIYIALSKMLEEARRIRGKNSKIIKLRLDGGMKYIIENMKCN